MTALAAELHDKLGKLDEATRNSALSTIFGARAIAGANVLYKEGGTGIAKWTKDVNDSGFAAQQAHGKMDNLNGDLSKLGAAFQNDLISAGGSVNSVLRDMVQSLTFLVKTFADIPGPVLAVGVVLVTLVAVLGLVGGGALKAVTAVANFKNALEDLKISGSTAGIALGAVGAALAILTVIAGAYIEGQQKAAQQTQDLADSLDKATGAITDYTRALQVKELHDNGSIQAANKLGISLRTVTDAALGSIPAQHQLAVAQDEFNKKKNEAIKAGQGDSQQIQNSIHWWTVLSSGVGSASDQMKAAKQSADNHRKAMADNGAAASSDATQLAVLTGTAQDASGAISDLASQIKDFGKAEFDVADTDRALHQSIDDVTTKLKAQTDAYKQAHGTLDGFNATLDISTQEGRDNSAGLEQIAKNTLAHAAAIETQTGDQGKATQAIADGRGALIQQLAQFGITGAAANEYADRLGLIPGSISSLMNFNDADARMKLDGLTTAVNKLDGRTVTIYAQANIDAASTALANAMRQANQFATGGAYSTHENGGIHAYADGGIGPGIYAGGTPLYKFAEPNTRFEAFISGKPGQEARNRMVWQDAGRMLGMNPGGGSGPTTVSLAGATILMSVDGRQMTAVIQDQIVSAASTTNSRIRSGKQKGAL
jgi:NADH:ubiquinone oxidoreductase subunit 6 (subunit J)